MSCFSIDFLFNFKICFCSSIFRPRVVSTISEEDQQADGYETSDTEDEEEEEQSSSESTSPSSSSEDEAADTNNQSRYS